MPYDSGFYGRALDHLPDRAALSLTETVSPGIDIGIAVAKYVYQQYTSNEATQQLETTLKSFRESFGDIVKERLNEAAMIEIKNRLSGAARSLGDLARDVSTRDWISADTNSRQSLLDATSYIQSFAEQLGSNGLDVWFPCADIRLGAFLLGTRDAELRAGAIANVKHHVKVNGDTYQRVRKTIHDNTTAITTFTGPIWASGNTYFGVLLDYSSLYVLSKNLGKPIDASNSDWDFERHPAPYWPGEFMRRFGDAEDASVEWATTTPRWLYAYSAGLPDDRSQEIGNRMVQFINDYRGAIWDFTWAATRVSKWDSHVQQWIDTYGSE